MEAFVCGPDNFHPYECQPETCKHCTQVVSDTHDPTNCALCDSGLYPWTAIYE